MQNLSISKVIAGLAVLAVLTEAELLSYSERQRLYGELEAMRWLQQRRNSTTGPEKSQ